MQPIEQNKKANIFNIKNDRILNNYSFLLNYDFDFFGMTKNFYLEYELNQNMLRELKLNFCQFFCMDENKLIDQIHKEKNKLLKKYPNFYGKISLKEINKAYSIFQNISIENTFKIRKEKLLESFFFPPILIYDKIDKNKLVLKIPEILGIIDELGLDYDWYIRLKNFKERLINNGNIQHIGTELSNITQEKQILHLINENRQSSNFEQIKIESSLIKTQEQYFEVVYSIRKMGALSYYIVDLYETLDNNIEQTPIKNDGNDIKNKIYSIKEHLLNNENLKKSNIRTTTKLNRFLSVSSLPSDLPNKEEGINSIKRNAKTKVFSTDICLKKNNVSFPSLNNNIKIIDNNEKQSKRNDSKKNINLNNNKFENKKEESDNSNNNSELKDNNQNENILKIIDKTENIKRKKSRKREYIEKEEEEEYSPLIAKDKFNEILNKNNKRNDILIIIIFIIIFISLILNIVKFAISLNGFEICKNVLKTTIYLEMLKIDIYVQTILSITYCINENEKITDISNIHSEAKLKIQSTINHIKLLQDQINKIINNNYCSEIIDILQEKIDIYNLNDDWSSSNETVNLMEELRSLSFKLDSLSYITEKCSITSTFYIYNINMTNIYKSGKVPKANDIQKIVYYFLRNIFTSYKLRLDQLSEETSNTIEKLWVNFKNNIFYLIISIFLIIIIFSIFYIIKVCFDYSYYQLLILYYYNMENEQLKFENQIYYLNRAIYEFNCDTIDYFEYVKSNPHLIYYNKDINKTHSNYIKNINNDLHNNINHSITKEKKNNKRKSSIIKNLENIIDKNSINSNILNGSMNGSSLLFLNNSNNKISLDNNFKNNNSFIENTKENDENKNSKEDSIDSLLNISKKILPNSIKISLFFIFLGIIIYLIFCFWNIIIVFSEDKIWRYSINLSMNVLERIPRLMDMLIYACLTVINNNDKLLKGNPFNDNQSKYLTYFKTNSLYYSEEMMHKYFENKYFGELIRDNLRISYNLDNYLFQENENIFTNTKEWELELRKSGYFCINAAKGEVISFQEQYSIYEFAELMNYYGTSCINDNTGINDSGAQLEIIYILQEITNKYIEFITYNISNITLEEARKKFFGSSDLRRIIVDMQLSLVLYYNTICYAVNKDFDKKNHTIIIQQILFSILLFFINFFIIIGLIASFKKNENYKKLFCYFSINSINNNNNL